MDVNFVVTVPTGTELYRGRHIRVQNVSKAAPVPEWIPECAREYDGPVSDPWLVDAAAAAEEGRAVQRARTIATTPDTLLSKEALWKKRPWTRNPQLFDLARTQYQYPVMTRCLGHSFTATENVFSDRADDTWHEARRASIAQQQLFLGD